MGDMEIPDELIDQLLGGGLQVVDASAAPTSTCLHRSLATTKAVASII
jgi:hypothetical protein